ncbi:MAG: LacI family DNA-binding transcriptional regulator [Arachnia sp.]
MAEDEGRLATLADVAKAARVSQSTASKALNQKD